MHWYALQTKPHKEFLVYELLVHEGIEAYLPFVRVKPKNPRAAKQRPYFPGYMFVQLDLENPKANVLKWMQGTKGLISFGGIPAVVPASLIDQLSQQIEAIEAAGDLQDQAFKPGDRVKIVEGPFAGYEAIFDVYLPSKERVQVLLAFLSSYPQPIKLDQQDIQQT